MLMPPQSVPVTYPAGLGEPINVILSGNSDAAVLVDQPADGGLRNYFLCVGHLMIISTVATCTHSQ